MTRPDPLRIVQIVAVTIAVLLGAASLLLDL